MDLSETIAPDSQQLDAIDLVAPRTFTITQVSKGNPDQPVNISLAEFPRAWRPGKTVRRILVKIWGPDASTYVGRRVTLFNDESVTFGGVATGGVRISHMSHIDKPVTLTLPAARGKYQRYQIDPLPVDAPADPEPTAEQIAAATDENELRDWYRRFPALREQINARVAELRAGDDA